MTRRFHLALGVADLAVLIADYSARLGMEPECVVPGEYALWRTEGLHVSIRVVRAAEAGQLRHLGWEEPEAASSQPILISGCIGPRGDSYVADQQMSADEAEAFHRWQIAVLAGAGVNLVSAFTVSAAPEAVGIVRAAGSEGVPVVVSFTLETDGRLPSGQPLAGADRWAAGERLPQEPCRARCGRKPGCRRSPGAGCGVPAAERAAAPPGGAGGLLRHRSTPCGRDRPGHPASALGSPAAALIPEDASPGAALHRLTNDLQHRLLAYLEQIARPRHAQ